MQISEIAGILVLEPGFSYITEDEQLFLCRSVISDCHMPNGRQDVQNLHILVCFGDKARYMAQNCKQGQMIHAKGRFLNWNYTDYNETRHYTEFFLAEEIKTISEENAAMQKEPENTVQSSDDDALCYMKEKGYSVIDESIFARLEEVMQCSL